VHLNVLAPLDAASSEVVGILDRAKHILNAAVDRRGGSISAEHGIGRMKRADFDARLRGPARELLAALKAALDPDGRMNPGALHI
jgi:FAD/FMN-containing dehydrogenase